MSDQQFGDVIPIKLMKYIHVYIDLKENAMVLNKLE